MADVLGNTVNLAERFFEEERRRTKLIPRLMDERPRSSWAPPP
jgi:hypothetical protein